MMVTTGRTTTARGATSPGHPRVDAHRVLLLDPLAVPGPAGEPIPTDPDAADTWFRAEFEIITARPGSPLRLSCIAMRAANS